MGEVMSDAFSRTGLLIGAQGLEALARSTVAIFGLGGVGSWVGEALARSGVGGFLLVDCDQVASSNINRQILALRSTIGRAKVEVMRERILEINPDARVEAREEVYAPGDPTGMLRPGLSFVVDAIDSISSKLDLIVRAQGLGLAVISAMGAGNKFDPTRFEVADIYDTSICPLARVIRRELRHRGVTALKVVYSRETPVDIPEPLGPSPVRRSTPGSLSFVTPVEGFIIAAEVVKEILENSRIAL